MQKCFCQKVHKNKKHIALCKIYFFVFFIFMTSRIFWKKTHRTLKRAKKKPVQCTVYSLCYAFVFFCFYNVAYILKKDASHAKACKHCKRYTVHARKLLRALQSSASMRKNFLWRVWFWQKVSLRGLKSPGLKTVNSRQRSISCFIGLQKNF